MAVANALVQVQRNGAGLLQRGGVHLKHIHTVEDGVGNAACIVGRGDPDDLAGINRHLRKLVGKALRGVVLQQAVQGTQRVVLRVAAGLVDFVHHDDGVGVFALHQGLEHLARACAFPLCRRPRQQPASGHGAHRQQVHARAQQLGQVAGKVGLADAGWAQQQHGGHLQPIAAVLRQGYVAFHIVQHVGEVGQQLVQAAHVGHP